MLIFAEITIIFTIMSTKKSIEKSLNKRLESGNLRKLSLPNNRLIDFSSNDYLGLARSSDLKDEILRSYESKNTRNGSTGSRLLTGNSSLIEKTEYFLASLFGFESSTLFSSGYMANLAFFSSIPQKGDTVIYDELSHACIKDGLRLNFAKRLPFKHNSIKDLETKIKQAKGNIYVVCESVYSMDGDLASLKQIAALCSQHKANLIVDEAHSTGIWGEHGQGLVHEMSIQNQVFAVIHTFGKAMGIHGASISGDKSLKEFLHNFARPFIYTTAPSDFEVISIQCAFDYLAKQPNRQANLFFKIAHYNKMMGSIGQSAIQTIMTKGNQNTRNTAQKLQSAGFDVRPILSPTVKEGSERLRICLHSFNSEEEISSFAQHLKSIIS